MSITAGVGWVGLHLGDVHFLGQFWDGEIWLWSTLEMFSVLTGDSGAAASLRENVKHFNRNFEQILYLLRHDFCRRRVLTWDKFWSVSPVGLSLWETGWVAVEASRGGSNEMFSEIAEELRKVWEEPLKWDSWELRGLGHWAPCGICFAYDYQVTDYHFHLAILFL